MKLFRSAYLLTCCMAFMIGSLGLKAQTLRYEATVDGQKAGYMEVTKEVSDERVKIWVKAEVQSEKPVKIDNYYESLSTYMDGKLIESEVVRHTHERKYSGISTIWNKGRYEVRSDDSDNTLTYPDQELLGTDLFFFEEPEMLNQVYALGTTRQIPASKDPANDQYYYFDHLYKKEHLIYENGIVKELKAVYKTYTIIFRCIP